MFEWLKKLGDESTEIRRIASSFRDMLTRGRRIYELASDAALGAATPEAVRKEIFETDVQINRLEQAIRRELVVHASVHGSAVVPGCLVLMSIAKDAERIGDYAKNIFDLSVRRPILPGDTTHAELLGLRAELDAVLGEVPTVHQAANRDSAKALLRRAEALEDRCDKLVDELLDGTRGTPGEGVAAALLARYFKRTAAHAKNVVSSVVMPVDKLDFFDER
ncbi:MAG: PhoU domain-containing protein [Planctomycetota bacterium]